jgi:hypothetical protein
MPPPNTAVQLAFQVCPIILTGGAASQVPSSMIALLQLFYGTGQNSIGLPFDIGDLDDAFGAFNVLPGGTLVSQQIGKYPFANQYTAANATIQEPLTISVIMDSPMRTPQAFSYKQAIMTALKGTLEQHNNLGGTYTVMTPSYMYTDLILTALTDSSRGNNSLPQNAWRFDFERPLVSLADLQGSQNNLMSKITNGFPSSGDLSGIQVGTLDAQTSLALRGNANAGLAGGLTSNVPSVGNVAQNYLNYPVIPSAGGFPFSGVS